MNNWKKIQSLGLFVNTTKAEAETFVPEIVAAASAAGIALLAEPTARLAAVAASIEEMLAEADAVLVLGGDGTILRAIDCMRGNYKPILGINLGTLGFLAECMPSELYTSIARLAEGAYSLEQRMLLRARLEGEDAVFYALNDIVVTRGSFGRMIHADTYVGGMLAASFEGDGAIVASPTGSTAYSLSAGGPIVSPDMDCFILTPICPHTLSGRPMVVSAASAVRMEVTPRGEGGGMQLTVDGAQRRILRERSVLHIRRSERTLPFIRFGGDDFFALLRGKLSKWGGAALPEEGDSGKRKEEGP